MIGDGYWATGITVMYGYSGEGEYGWKATVDFLDDGWAGDDHDDRVSTEGRLTTRYQVRDRQQDGLTAAIDTVKADAERLGITFKQAQDLEPYIWYESDGDSEDYPPPDGWRQMLAVQSARLGWRSVYGPVITPQTADTTGETDGTE